MILGYEICGKVVTVGRKVAADCPIKEGDVVVIYPWPGCGQCEICSSGNSHLCEEQGIENVPEETNESSTLAATENALSINYSVIQVGVNLSNLYIHLHCVVFTELFKTIQPASLSRQMLHCSRNDNLVNICFLYHTY